ALNGGALRAGKAELPERTDVEPGCQLAIEAGQGPKSSPADIGPVDLRRSAAALADKDHEIAGRTDVHLLVCTTRDDSSHPAAGYGHAVEPRLTLVRHFGDDTCRPGPVDRADAAVPLSGEGRDPSGRTLIEHDALAVALESWCLGE